MWKSRLSNYLVKNATKRSHNLAIKLTQNKKCEEANLGGKSSFPNFQGKAFIRLKNRN